MNEKFSLWFKGNAQAVEFAAMLWEACQQWDDIEDDGRCENHNALLAWLAFGKEYHPFFSANSAVMRPAMLSMYLQWRAANTLERGDLRDVEKAFMLRAGIYSVWHLMAWIVGGDDWAAAVGPEIYREYAETPQTLWSEFNA